MRSKTLFQFGIIIGICAVSLLILGSEPALAKTKTLVFADGKEARHLFPHNIGGGGRNRISSICEPLVWVDASFKPQPAIAISWDVVDGKVWRFHIRKGVTFHNGEELTAEDVAYTFAYAQDPKNKDGRIGLVKDIKYKVLDDYTIDLWQEGKFNPILHILLFDINILPKDTLTRVGTEEFSRAPIGTGPFQFVEWKRGEHVKLKAYKKYWGGTPKLDYVIVKPVPEQETRIAGLKTGVVDIIGDIPHEILPSLRKDPEIEIKSVDSTSALMLGFSLFRPLFNNIYMRKAVAHAIDSSTICRTVLGGLATPLGQPTPPSCFGYNPNIKPYKYDPTLAKEYLKKAGYRGETILFESESGRYYKDLEVTTAIAGYLGAIGINIDFRVLDWSTFLDKYMKKSISPLWFIRWTNNSGDGSENIHDIAYSKSSYHYWGDKTNLEVDRLIELSRGTIDKTKRKEAIQKANQILHDVYYCGMYYSPMRVYGVRTGVKWEHRPDDLFIVTKDTDKLN